MKVAAASRSRKAPCASCTLAAATPGAGEVERRDEAQEGEQQAEADQIVRHRRVQPEVDAGARQQPLVEILLRPPRRAEHAVAVRHGDQGLRESAPAVADHGIAARGPGRGARSGRGTPSGSRSPRSPRSPRRARRRPAADGAGRSAQATAAPATSRAESAHGTQANAKKPNSVSIIVPDGARRPAVTDGPRPPVSPVFSSSGRPAQNRVARSRTGSAGPRGRAPPPPMLAEPAKSLRRKITHGVNVSARFSPFA